MNIRLPPRPGRCTSARRKPAVLGLAAICLLLSLGLLLAACGGSSSNLSTSSSNVTSTTGSARGQSSSSGGSGMTPTQLGEAIGTTWAEAIQKLNTLIEGLPEASTVQAQMSTLKEEYVQKMVAFGRQRQALDTPGQAEVDTALQKTLSDAESADWFKTYKSDYEEYSYRSGDVEFVNTLASFNVLTQYADFAALKAENPDEAARLGIE